MLFLYKSIKQTKFLSMENIIHISCSEVIIHILSFKQGRNQVIYVRAHSRKSYISYLSLGKSIYFLNYWFKMTHNFQMFLVSTVKLSILRSYLFGSITCYSIIPTTISEDRHWYKTFWNRFISQLFIYLI